MNSKLTKHRQSSFIIRHSPFETAILFLLAFGVYLRGLAPTVASIFDDSLEFPLVVHRLAIAHPTGYPLFTLLGKLFSLLAPQRTAFLLNLMTALFGALAVALTYRAGLAVYPKEKTTARRAGMWLAALMFGLGPVFFSQATLVEVYTLNAAFIAALLWLALRKKWLALAVVFGLSLTHHRTAILTAPALAIVLISHYPLHRRDGWWQLWRDIPPLKAAFALLAPLALYLYLPLRGAVGSLDGSYENSWAGFWRHVMGGGYGTTFLLGNPFGNERGLSFYADLLRAELGWWGLALAAVGIIALMWRKNWRALALTGVAFATFLAFNLQYTVTDIAVFFIPVFLILALWAGVGLGEMIDLVEHSVHRIPTAGTTILLAILLLWRGAAVDESRAGQWDVHDYGLDALAQPAPNGTVVGILGEMTLLRYVQEVEGVRPDIRTIAADRDDMRRDTVARLLSAGETVYITRELPGMPAEWRLSAAGPLIRVSDAPIPAPNFDTALNTAITPEITLAGYSVTRPPSHHTPAPIRLTLVWQAVQSPPVDLKVSARLLDGAGNVVAVADAVPVHFAFPTGRWHAGDAIADVYDLQLPAGTSGTFTPLIILYDPANGAAEVGRVELPPVTVE